MKFIDEAKIFLKAGDGGQGCVSFRREKYVPRGGPDGGNGGRGAHIYFQAGKNLNTLMDFHYNRHFRAEAGKNGKGKTMHGRAGVDMVIPVPLGTVVFNADSGDMLFDFIENGQKEIMVHGGHGGRGNASFTSSVRQAPRFAQEGELGEEKNIRLELKLIADVGLIGFPNAGKSTFLSVISNATPKIADYPFTTMAPILGVVKSISGEPFVVADLPGLIEGAHQGKGLGDQFLKHGERTKIYLHLISLGPDEAEEPFERYLKIENELSEYDIQFKKKKHLVLLTKSDLLSDKDIRTLQSQFKKKKIETIVISSLTKKNLDKVIRRMGELLSG